MLATPMSMDETAGCTSVELASALLYRALRRRRSARAAVCSWLDMSEKAGGGVEWSVVGFLLAVARDGVEWLGTEPTVALKRTRMGH